MSDWRDELEKLRGDLPERRNLGEMVATTVNPDRIYRWFGVWDGDEGHAVQTSPGDQ